MHTPRFAGRPQRLVRRCRQSRRVRSRWLLLVASWPSQRRRPACNSRSALAEAVSRGSRGSRAVEGARILPAREAQQETQLQQVRQPHLQYNIRPGSNLLTCCIRLACPEKNLCASRQRCIKHTDPMCTSALGIVGLCSSICQHMPAASAVKTRRNA